MRSRGTLGLIVFAALYASGVGCQPILGIEDRALDPVNPGCALPSPGSSNIRFANLVPTDVKVDVCIRTSGSNYGRPTLRGGGLSGLCAAGLAYPEVTAPFAAPAGKVDVKVIRAGETCEASALSELTIDVVAGRTTTVTRLGSERLGEELAAYLDTNEQDVGSGARVRIVHASKGSPPYRFGFTRDPTQPTEVKDDPLILAEPLAFKASTTPATRTNVGSIDGHGYLRLPGQSLPVGIAPIETSRATAMLLLPTAALPRTLFIVGDSTKPYMPVRLLLCDEQVTVDQRTQCIISSLNTLSIDQFHAYLLGPHALDEDLRREPILEALSSRDSDLVCASAISRKQDRTRLVQRSKEKGTFPYSINVVTTLDTKPSDPRDVFPAPSRAACGAPVAPAEVDAALGCIQAQCSTTHTPDGTLAGGTNCLTSNCVSSLVPLYAGTPEQRTCFNCIVGSALSETTHAASRTQCTTDLREFKTREGDNAVVVLSKYPLHDVDTFVLPSTQYQRVVHYAKVEIEPANLIDYFCTELNAQYGDALPYVGHYAPPGASHPWSEEQVFQGLRALEWIRKRAGARPAIISGDWAVSRQYTDSIGNVIIAEQGGARLLDTLDKELVPALPEGFVPQCTECAAPVNPYNVLNFWHYRTYVLNMPTYSGAAAGVFFNDLPLTTSGGERRPLSARWGFNTRVLRP